MPKQLDDNSRSRYDFQLISDWVAPNSKVLDLGCGNGRLLQHLQTNKNATGYGLELSSEMISECINNDINIIQTNLDKGLRFFDDNSFDYVILSLTLQAMQHPKNLLQEMMRVGKQGIVTFPNFAYWRNRLQIALSGEMPVSDELPYKWYDTPNIHLCTIRDFSALCHQLGFQIDDYIAVHSNDKHNLGLKIAPNLFGEIALCRFSKRSV